MKRFILPLMILLFVGSLLAVESAPSEVVGYVKYDLVAGNNTIALAMDEPYAFASEVGDAIAATAVGQFNATTQEWELILAFPWGGWDSDFAVSNGKALWITVDDATSFYSIGDLPATDPSYSLVAGNNMIMVPLSQSALDYASLVGDEIGATTVGQFNTSTQEWELILAFPWGGWDSDFPTTIGSPLWITTDNDGTWPSRSGSTFRPRSVNK